MQDFIAEITKDKAGRLTYFMLPFNAKEVFDKSEGTIYVKGTINEVPYRSKLLSRGSGKYIMTLDKVFQKSIGFSGGTFSVHVVMSLDNVNVKGGVDAGFMPVSGTMDVVTAIKTRQSIRQFTSLTIDEDVLNTILYAGLCAPTAKDKRPCHFIIIKNKEILSELSHRNQNAGMLAAAACAIVVCGDRNIEGMKELLYADCAAAAQNILLCIHGLNLGGVWCGVIANSDWQKLIIKRLDLPLKTDPIAVIAIGHPAMKKSLCERWEPEKIHYDIW